MSELVTKIYFDALKPDSWLTTGNIDQINQYLKQLEALPPSNAGIKRREIHVKLPTVSLNPRLTTSFYTVREWLSEQTDGKIPDYEREYGISDLERMTN